MKALLVYLLIPLLVFFSCNSNPQEGAVAYLKK